MINVHAVLFHLSVQPVGLEGVGSSSDGGSLHKQGSLSTDFIDSEAIEVSVVGSATGINHEVLAIVSKEVHTVLVAANHAVGTCGDADSLTFQIVTIPVVQIGVATTLIVEDSVSAFGINHSVHDGHVVGIGSGSQNGIVAVLAQNSAILIEVAADFAVGRKQRQIEFAASQNVAISASQHVETATVGSATAQRQVGHFTGSGVNHANHSSLIVEDPAASVGERGKAHDEVTSLVNVDTAVETTGELLVLKSGLAVNQHSALAFTIVGLVVDVELAVQAYALTAVSSCGNVCAAPQFLYNVLLSAYAQSNSCNRSKK